MPVLVRTLIFTVLVPGTVAVWIPYRLLPAGAEFSLRGYSFIGLLLIGVGAAVYLWCAAHFTFTGRGTPAPIDPPRVLVAKGPYRLVRNPMYIGVWLVLVGEAVVFGSLRLVRYAFLVALLFHLVVILYEEPVLRKKFGPAYEEYCRSVPRWIPRLARTNRA